MTEAKKKILIVDDMPENIVALGSLLQQHYQVKVATTGQKAIEISIDQHPDLILLDIMLPDIDGYTVCKRLKADERTGDIPVIFITGRLNPEDEIRGFELGGVDYITKPFNPKVVLVRIKTQIELKVLRDYYERQSSTDALTGLWNRRKLYDELERLTSDSDNEFALLFIDLDGFKLVNDTYGHACGDYVLKSVADRLIKMTGRKGVVARYGGDEFTVIYNECIDKTCLSSYCRSLIDEINLPIEWSDESVQVGSSVGVSRFPVSGDSLEKLKHVADDLMYEIKRGNKNGYLID